MRNALIILGLILIVCSGQAVSLAADETQTVLSADSVQIAFSVYGKGKPALVFIHGWCCDQSYWRYQVPEFSKSFTVVTIDLAGHGESGLNRKQWTIDAFGKDVVAVVEKLGLDKVILIGHSMGGMVIMEAAKRMPDRVAAMVGVDTFQDLERQRDEQSRTQFLAAFKADFAGATKEFVQSMFPSGADSALIARVTNDMASAPPEVGIGAIEGVFGYKTRGALEGLKIPLYAINADRWPTNVEAGKRQAYSFEVKYMPGRGHFVMLEDPETFNKLLAETIAEIGKR